MLKRIAGIIVALLALDAPALAQTPFVRVSASVTLAVTSVSANVAIGTSTRISNLWICNTGANDAYLFFGDSTVVADTTGTILRSGVCGNISPDGKTTLAAVTASSTTSLVITPGSGVLFGTGGGGSGGGGGAVTAAAGSYASGAIPDIAAAGLTDAASCASTTSVLACLRQMDADIKGSIPAGTAIIGKVGIDQTTPGTTNGVAIVGVNGATALAGNGATGTGSPRVTIASDNSAIAAAGQVATGAAPPAGTQYIGANASGATGGHIAGLIICDSHVFKHITSATDTLAVQGVASQSVYICGWRSRAAGTATWFLENTASANANCSSSNTQITGLASEVANSGEVLAPGFWSGLKNTAGNGLCINSTGTGGVDVDVWYAQF